MAINTLAASRIINFMEWERCEIKMVIFTKENSETE